jgi:hypothetical protein
MTVARAIGVLLVALGSVACGSGGGVHFDSDGSCSFSEDVSFTFVVRLAR